MLIIVAGLTLRIDHAWQGSTGNLPDSAAYERIARGLHEQGAYEQTGPGTPAHPQPVSNYSPGLPLLAGGIFELAGNDDVRLVRIVLAMIGAIAIPLTFLIGRRLSPIPEGSPGADAAGLIAAGIVAFYPTLINSSEMLLTEPLAGTLVAAGLLATLRARDQPRLLSWLGVGVLFGLVAMVRPEYLLVAMALAFTLIAIDCRGGLRQALLPVAVSLVGLIVVIAPWTLRNSLEYNRPVPLSTGGGQTLFSGSYLASGGNPTKVMPDLLRRRSDLRRELEWQNRLSGEGADSITPERAFALLAAQRYPDLDTDAALSRIGRERYLDELRDDPVGLGDFLFHKTARIWWRGRSDLMSTMPGRLLHRGVVIAAMIGLLSLLVRRRPEFWIFASILGTATLIGTLLVASPRRALVLWPLVSVLAGLGLVEVLGLAKSMLQRRREPVAIA